ncbi:hypothetical protein C2R22_21495 (plasmid) [Salinigranum rubrum]|uniref:Peptidase S54 rhomboid domain-containing protein n=1 Tax=Salinigranum rubrum TaxID=755307 RepID=A0A2I8VQH1_9EURY|nr:hypothetical protein [Salinigranum rubrum]AUV84155.1 hypothetical protein C2R22_21495 [Salinigranum rubrum]
MKPNDESIWIDISENIRVSDISLLLTVPLVLLAVYLLPMSMQQSLLLEFDNPSIIQLWSSSYVHDGYIHLITNIALYGLCVFPSYLFLILANERQLFRYIFLVFLFIGPPVIALVLIIRLHGGTGAGFSGIAAAFVGLIPVSIVMFIRKRVSSAVYPSVGMVFFLVVLAVVGATYSGVPAAVGLLVLSGLFLHHHFHLIGQEEVQRLVSELPLMKGYFMLMVVAMTFFLVSPVFLFPENVIQNNHTVSAFVHYVGLCFGYLGSTLICIYIE